MVTKRRRPPWVPRVPPGAKSGLNRELWVVPTAFVSWFFRFRFLELIWVIKVRRGLDPPLPHPNAVPRRICRTAGPRRPQPNQVRFAVEVPWRVCGDSVVLKKTKGYRHKVKKRVTFH